MPCVCMLPLNHSVAHKIRTITGQAAKLTHYKNQSQGNQAIILTQALVQQMAKEVLSVTRIYGTGAQIKATYAALRLAQNKKGVSFDTP